MPCIPPGPVDSEKRFPPKTFSGPPADGILCRQCGPFILPGSPPDSVTLPRQDRLCRRKNLSPLHFYYTMRRAKKQIGKFPRKREKRACSRHYPGWACSVYRNPFIHPGQKRTAGPAIGGNRDSGETGAPQASPAKKNESAAKKTPGAKTSGDGMLSPAARSVRTDDSDRTHFGMRKPGTGICISSYMFMYWAKRM